VLARGPRARQQRLLRRARIERLDAGAQRGGDLVRLAIEIRLQARAPHLERGVAGAGEHRRHQERHHHGYARPQRHPADIIALRAI
jgi:hypothetical protein